MLKNTGVFPAVPVAPTGQSLISHAGLNVLTSFVDSLGFKELCENRLGQFVPAQARHRPSQPKRPKAQRSPITHSKQCRSPGNPG